MKRAPSPSLGGPIPPSTTPPSPPCPPHLSTPHRGSPAKQHEESNSIFKNSFHFLGQDQMFGRTRLNIFSLFQAQTRQPKKKKKRKEKKERKGRKFSAATRQNRLSPPAAKSSGHYAHRKVTVQQNHLQMLIHALIASSNSSRSTF